MAVTITDHIQDIVGHGDKTGRIIANSQIKIGYFKIQFDSAYPLGGETVDFTARGFDTVLVVLPGTAGSDSSGASGGYAVSYDYVNKKLKLHGSGAATSGVLAELDGADVHKVFVYLTVIGI